MKINLTLGDTQLIISTAKKHGLLRNQLAYVLATALWETAHTMKPVKEAYWNSETWRKNNLRYYPWYGRGYVQLTWEENYKKAQKILGLGTKLTSNPDNALDPSISAEVLVVGSRDGWFRKGHTLSKYITLNKSDFFGAREIINGDKNYTKDVTVNGKKIKKKIGEIIADYAKQYDQLLKAAGYGENNTTIKPTTPNKDEFVSNIPSPTSEFNFVEWLITIISKLFGSNK